MDSAVPRPCGLPWSLLHPAPLSWNGSEPLSKTTLTQSKSFWWVFSPSSGFSFIKKEREREECMGRALSVLVVQINHWDGDKAQVLQGGTWTGRGSES